MKRVLFIAYLYPPIANSGTRRSLSFVNHLPDFGWEPLVLTVSDRPAVKQDAGSLAEVRSGTHIERVGLWSESVAAGAARLFAPAAMRESAAAALTWRLNILVQVPDEMLTWYPTAVRRALKLHREVGFDLIYASGWPWTSFLIARAVGLRTGCPYVLDYRDLWKPTGTHEWEAQTRSRRWFGPALERFAARRAAAIVTVTPTLVNMIRRDAQVSHIHCITNGFEPADFVNPHAEPASKVATSVCIAYTGVWRPGYGLEDLYLAVRLLKDRGQGLQGRLKISAAGFEPGHAERFGVQDVVEEHGILPHDQALHLMTGADALYLSVPLGFYAKASLPGKMFEYLGSGRPILAVVPSDSEVARVLTAIGGSLQIEPGDIEGLAAAIEGICRRDGSAIFGLRHAERLNKYTRAATTEALSEVFGLALQRHEAEV